MVDEGIVKCVQYWPETEGQEEVYENIIIELTDTQTFAHFTIYSMKLRHVNDRNSVRYVSQQRTVCVIFMTTAALDGRDGVVFTMRSSLVDL